MNQSNGVALPQLQTKLKQLEYKLEKTRGKHNESLAQINMLKEKVNMARRERVIFSNVFKKLEGDIKQKDEEFKKYMIEKIHIDNKLKVYEEELKKIKQKAQKQNAQFKIEYEQVLNQNQNDEYGNGRRIFDTEVLLNNVDQTNNMKNNLLYQEANNSSDEIVVLKNQIKQVESQITKYQKNNDLALLSKENYDNNQDLDIVVQKGEQLDEKVKVLQEDMHNINFKFTKIAEKFNIPIQKGDLDDQTFICFLKDIEKRIDSIITMSLYCEGKVVDVSNHFQESFASIASGNKKEDYNSIIQILDIVKKKSDNEAERILNKGDFQQISKDVIYHLECLKKYQLNLNLMNIKIIINPLKGIIPGEGKIDIQITYIPQTNVTVISEAELKVSQFDFEPLKIRLMGSARYKDPAENKTKKQINTSKLPQSNSRLEKLNKQQTCEQNKENQLDSQPQLRIENIEQDKDIQNQEQQQELQEIQSSEFQSNFLLNNTEELARSSYEKQFLNKCSIVNLLQKNKEIKFFQCIGDCDMTEVDIEEIYEKRNNFQKQILDGINIEGQNRFEIVLNNDQPQLDFEKIPQYQTTWDFDKNNDLKNRKINLNKFMSVGTKIILRIRADKRLEKLKNKLSNLKTREEVKKMVSQDQQRAEYLQIGKKENISFQISNNINIVHCIKFPIQYDASNTFNNYAFKIEERKDFDDLHDYDVIQKNNIELMKYESKLQKVYFHFIQLYYNIEINFMAYHIYPSIEFIREQRTGGENEYFDRGKMGITKQYYEFSNQINNLPKTFFKYIDIPLNTFITPHNSLRPYIQLNQNTESNEAYFLKSEYYQINDNLDPLINSNINFKILKNDYLYNTPGYFTQYVLNNDTSEMSRYYQKLLDLPTDNSIIKFQDHLFSSTLQQPQDEDQLTDDDSDGETPPQMQVQNVVEFLKLIEDKDSTINQIREQNKNRLPYDEYEQIFENINKNLQNDKEYRISTFNSKVNNYNKFIKDQNNKLIIL
ncbi:hypothetical protein IMG5_152520 [Ichthyophthirius multifiliis]|uniref:Uncharacterized protein n=1 Tax=Ichthyophthirius multifiliis TaxID=5932 RepID=G0QYV7_ICHMU|nr:hypothetical protein IMG5_152520 [Ichthyophthirius multifiliis]EGR29602.1 hypothetical protein IMG5_152520 [Ichthyophthirius multifiliis]|eukprot:XP_004030838.1 hypothetical protein IMG5_152520 [Ichthyophthirius multifiliis]